MKLPRYDECHKCYFYKRAGTPTCSGKRKPNTIGNCDWYTHPCSPKEIKDKRIKEWVDDPPF